MYKINGTEKDLDKYIKEEKVVITVYAEYCSTCEMMAPVLEELGKKENGISVIKLKVDDNQDFVTENKIMGTPTHFLFKSGKQIKRLEGYLPVEAFEKELNG